jgi:hypothetical protein
VIFESASGERKVPRSQFFPHTGWSYKRRKNYVSPVMSLDEVLEKDQRYLKSLVVAKEKQSRQQKNSEENSLAKAKPEPKLEPKPKKKRDPLADIGL